MSDKYATNDEPTEPREPTRYPSCNDFLTSSCAILYITAKPLPMIELSSLSRRFWTFSGRGVPYISSALLIESFLIPSTAPSTTGGHFFLGIGRTSPIISAIRFVFVTTTSYALSLPKYANSSSISFVVLKYKGA